MDSDWAGLPKHLLDLVLEKLELSLDYLQFGAVCLQWHSILKDSQIKRSKTLQYHHIPMLLIPSEEQTWSIYNTLDNKFFNTKLFVPYNKRFSGSSQGWLVAVNKDWTVTLYKPYSMVKGGNNIDTNILLPCLFPPDLEHFFDPDGIIDYAEVYDYHIEKALLTADPLTNPNECMIVVIFGEMQELAIFRIAKDTTWTKINAYDHDNKQIMLEIKDICHHNNQIYVVDVHGVLRSFDATDPCNPTVNLVAPRIQPRASDRYFVKRYLVESYGGKLLLVERHLSWRNEDDGRETKKFRVFRFDFDRAKWIKIKSLGDVSLFLGDNSSISVLASNFIGCEPDSIYFTHDIDDTDVLGQNVMICDVGNYHVRSRTFKLHYNIDSKVLMTMNRRPPIWVVPTLNTY